MTGFLGDGLAGGVGTWVAALVTILVWSYLLGERRLFQIAQHVLAGLATGYLVLLSLREVLVPRLAEPLTAEPFQNPLLWPAAVLVAVIIASRWLPRPVVAVPVAVLLAGTTAFAFGGAVAGTVLPQLAGSLPLSGADGGGVLNALIGATITVLVLVAFLQGLPRGRVLAGMSTAGRWLLLGGIGGWLGFLLVSRLALVVDRLRFLLADWLGILR